MSQTKAQLIQPIGIVTAGGVVVTGVVTASSFDGDVVGTATSIISGGNLNLGDVNATTFSGDFTGNATGINTGADIKVGSFTATSFTGDFTGTATSMMRGTGFEAGAVNATGFEANVTGNVTGNATGLAGSVTSGGNIHVGVMTATSYSGDGSNLTGIAATNFNTQTVDANSSETIIDLADGNCITMTQSSDTTVGFASTSEAMDVTLIRKAGGDYNISYVTGGLTCDGNGDYLSLASTVDFDFGTGNFTIELWAKFDSYSGSPYFFDFRTNGGDTGTTDKVVWYTSSSTGKVTFWKNGSAQITSNEAVTTGTWAHYALVRTGSNLTTMYINGVSQGSVADTTNYSNAPLVIGQRQGSYASQSFDGVLSQVRINKTVAVYTGEFVPPSAALTNITGTVLLCCQSDSSTTASTVTPGTITENGDPSAGAQTIALSGTTYLSTTITWPDSVQWNGGSAPTLISAASSTAERQQFEFITRDTGLNWYAWETFKNDPLNLQLFSWGSNANEGQLGQNDRTDRSSPTQIGSEGKWHAASGNANGQAAIKSDGTIWAWGDNSSGQLGQNDKTLRSSPVQVGTNKNWKSLQLGNNTCWALTTGGTMYCWGINPDGQYGSGNVIPRSSPIQIGETGIWSSIQQAGNGTGAAFKTDETLWRWGANNNGELGMNDRTYYSSPIQIGTGTWKSFGGGKEFNLAVDGDGKLWAMGRNQVGQLGLNQGGPSARQSSPTQVGTGTDWASVTGGKYWSAALKTDGSLYAWGVNNNGNLGQNSRLPSDNTGISSPVQIPGTWSQIRGNNSGFVGGKSDGTMWVWGYNNPGTLGLNTGYPSDPGRSSPTQLPGTWNVANISFYAEAGCMLGLKAP